MAGNGCKWLQMAANGYQKMFWTFLVLCQDNQSLALIALALFSNTLSAAGYLILLARAKLILRDQIWNCVGFLSRMPMFWNIRTFGCIIGMWNYKFFICTVYCVYRSCAYCAQCVLFNLCIIHCVFCLLCALFNECIVQTVFCSLCILFTVHNVHCL